MAQGTPLAGCARCGAIGAYSRTQYRTAWRCARLFWAINAPCLSDTRTCTRDTRTHSVHNSGFLSLLTVLPFAS